MIRRTLIALALLAAPVAAQTPAAASAQTPTQDSTKKAPAPKK